MSLDSLSGKLMEQLLDLGLSHQDAASLQEYLLASRDLPSEKIWQGFIKEWLSQYAPQTFSFSLHLLLYKTIYPHWNQLPAPAWFPEETEQTKNNIHLTIWIKEQGFQNFAELQQWSSTDRQDFWEKITKKLNIIFDKPYSMVSDFSKGIENPVWFKDSKINIMNTCFTAPGDAIAIIESDESGNSHSYSYQELNNLSNQIANYLLKHVKRGESIAIIMPMNFVSVAAYLGVIKAGATVVSIAESFSADEITLRLNIASCCWVFTQHSIVRDGKKLPLLEKIMATSVSDIVIVPSVQDSAEKIRKNIHPWKSILQEDKTFKPISCTAMDPINILFSSGTTGVPKAIPWDHTTPIKCASDAYFHHNMEASDKLCWPSSLGWMMGPWSIFAAFINQATLALYTGTPNGRSFGEFVQKHQITILGVVPTLVKHWRDTACMEKLDWSSIKVFSSTGECSNIEDMLYLMYLAGYRPIIEYCGGTEIGGAYITGSLLQPCAPATFTTPAMGLDFVILAESDMDSETGKPSDKGEVALIPPSIGLSTTLLNADHHKIYYENMPKLSDGRLLRRHGDQAEYYANHFYRLLGRVDDTMNLSGIKVSSAEIERVLNLDPRVLETAAIAIRTEGGGPEKLIIFVVLKTELNDSGKKSGNEGGNEGGGENGDDSGKDSRSEDKYDTQTIKQALQHLLKERLNPLFKITDLKILEKLPRTASNKVMRRILRDEYQNT